MLQKVFWFGAVFFFGLAVFLANASADAAGSGVVLDYRFWLVVALGTLSAVLGNILQATSSLDPEDDEQHGSHATH